MEKRGTIISTNLVQTLDKIIENWDDRQIYILTDKNTEEKCLPLLMQLDKIATAHKLSIDVGDTNKNLETVVKIWTFLEDNMATRHSLFINVGGGMITDIGGFAASTFKRGISYVNVATSLLGAVDAATGGKTGFNFNGYKNEIGVFAMPLATVIDVNLFKTLDKENILSGFSEMLKHGLISSEEHLEELMALDLQSLDYARLSDLVAVNVKVKEKIAADDPKELGLRKALNFGHTIGHAIESYLMINNKPVLHGYAVAWGMISELYLSYKLTGFPKQKFEKMKSYLLDLYGVPDLSSSDFDCLLELMKHDKKNRLGEINFTLLKDVGNVEIDQQATHELIIESIEKGLF